MSQLVSLFLVVFLLVGCVGKLEEETSATRGEVEKSNKNIENLEKSQGLFAAIKYMNDINDPNLSSRARFALMLFKQGVIKDTDSPILADDQIYFHVAAPAPLRMASHPKLRLRNATIINVDAKKPIDKDETVRSLHENIHLVQSLAVKQWIEKLFMESTDPANWDENREEAYRAILVGKTVLGAAFGKDRALDSGPEKFGVDAYYQTKEARLKYGNLMKSIRQNFKLWDRIPDPVFRAYLTTMGAESVL